MKKLAILLGLMMLTLQGGCQEDKIFKEQITVEKGIKFGDGTIQLTAPTGSQTVTWETLTGKPATFPPSTHNHNTLYRPITYVPAWAEVTSKPATFPPATHGHSYTEITDKPSTVELQAAIASMNVILIPKLTTAQINALAPVAGTLVYDTSLNVLKIANGSVWKTLITNQ